MGRLDGKVALITGTGGGQGRAAAVAFAAAGAKVVGCDVKAEGNQETVALVEAAGGTMTGFEPVDLGDPDEARSFVDAAVACYGGLDVVYNNAAAARYSKFSEMSIEDWQFAIRNELDLVFYVSRFSWSHLVARGGGVILNTASTAGMVATVVQTAAHAAAKGAMVAMTRQLALEGAPSGIRAVCISPGPIASPANAWRTKDERQARGLAKRTMLDRLGTSEDVARLAVFLASDDCGYVTGANVPVDGGMTAAAGMFLDG